jgi:sec-independent protein translocase protein TatC
MTSQNSQSFIKHLDELRKTLIKCLAAVAILFIPAFLAAPKAMNALISWACPPQISELNFFAPMEVLIIQLKLASVLAAAAAFPYCLWQIWHFLLPALYENERKALKWWVGASTFLFLAGACFCILMILPMVMKFSAGFSSQHIKPMIGLADFLGLSGQLVIAFGAMFQFPIAVMLAVRFGFVKHSFLSSKRPYIIVLILIVSALLTPPDVVSQIMLAVPTYLLFELGLFFSRGFKKKETTEQETEKNNTMLDFYIEEENKKNS